MSKKATSPINNIEHLIQIISNKYAPDKRVEVFSVEAIESEKGLLLNGETTNKTAYKELIAEAKKTHPHIEDNIRILPDRAIGERNWGVIYNSVANLHSKAAHSSEMVSQVLLGMPVRLLDKSADWIRIQTPEGYIGWISGATNCLSHQELKAHWRKPKIIITNHFTKSYTKADTQSQSVSDIVIGNMFTVDGEEADFYKVSYPDGRVAFVEKKDAIGVESWLGEIAFTGESIVKTAKQLMGAPYVWGGTSSKGLDCSGFTKIVYWLHGVIIPRDASQQVLCGVEIDNKGNFDNLEKGDLVFFGTKTSDEEPKEKVVHVGIYIGNMQFIHASDYIHISSFSTEDKLFDAFNTNRYLRTMRYIGSEKTTGIIPIVEHPFYSKE